MVIGKKEFNINVCGLFLRLPFDFLSTALKINCSRQATQDREKRVSTGDLTIVMGCYFTQDELEDIRASLLVVPSSPLRIGWEKINICLRIQNAKSGLIERVLGYGVGCESCGGLFFNVSGIVVLLDPGTEGGRGDQI